MERLSHRIWAGILIGIIAGNAVGLAAYLTLSTEAPSAAEPPPAPAIEETDPTSKAHRLAGLDAIERGDHEEAIREFSAGLRTPNPAPDLPQLLSIAQNMRQREIERVKAEMEAEAAATAAAEAAEDEEQVEPPPPPPPKPALLLVTTRPAKLAVVVDGEVRDMSPARIEVQPGRHRVIIRRGNDRLFQKTVRVEAGEVSLIDADVTDELAALEGPDPVDEDEAEVDRAAAAPPPRRRPAAELAAFPYLNSPDGDAGQAPGAAAARDPSAAQPPPTPAAATRTRPEAAPPPPPPPRARRSKASGQRRRGGIPQATVRGLVISFQPRFQRCYDRFRRVRRNLRGRVALRLRVGADGTVVDSEVAESQMPGSGINDCLARVARDMKFPRPSGGPATVKFGMMFQPD